MIRCRQCNAELTEQARFCAVCGTAQTFEISSVLEATSNDPATPASPSTNNEGSSTHLQPSVSVKPAKANKNVKKQISKEAKNALIRPKTVVRPPAFPSRPISNDMKPSVEIQQCNTSIPALSSARSVIPSRPDSNGQSISNQQSTEESRTPEYQLSSSIAKVPSSTHNKTGQRTSSGYTQPGVGNQHKQQVAQLATQRTQINSQPKVIRNSEQSRPQEQISGDQMTSAEPLWQNATTYDSDELSMRSTSTLHVYGNNGVSETPTMELLIPEAFMATSKSAEQWRKSWRDRQYAEAGPAENVSRGQASVPMPLTPMHQSLVRMRAIQKNDKKQQRKRSVNFGTWITILLMIGLIIGLGAYIFVSYIPDSLFGVTSVSMPIHTPQPTLVLVGTTSQSINIGRSIQLHGEHFGSNQTVIFLRDAAIPIVDKSDKNISFPSDNKGAFNVTIPTDSHWSAGSHSIEALDKSSSQSAFLTIQVMPVGITKTTSTELSVSMSGKPSSQLTFKAVMGQENPGPQQITITNTSGSPVEWTATTSTNNNLNWLLINDNNDYGQLAISQPHSILISVNTAGLKSADPKHPYLGQIIFTINNSQQLTLPVQLHIVDATPEMVFSPNPIIAQVGPGNTCQSDQPGQPYATLTLINLGAAAISWAVNPDIKEKIKFVSNGQLLESGTLLPSGSVLPSGQPGDTVVLTLQCNDIQSGHSYHVSVYANQLPWSELVGIQ